MISGKDVLRAREICMRQSLMTTAIRHSRGKEKKRNVYPDEIIVPDAVTLRYPAVLFPFCVNKRGLTEHLFTLVAFDNP